MSGRPSDSIKPQAALKIDKSVSEAEKKEDLAELEAALKNAKPVQFKENVALALKYFDKLAPLMPEQDSNLRPADISSATRLTGRLGGRTRTSAARNQIC